MPPSAVPRVNNPVVAAGIVAVSVAIMAAVALYESPEFRRHADQVRRRIAIALHRLGDGITPVEQPPMFNRPEDAYAYFQARSGVPSDPTGPPGVDADAESRRKQREEIMYWNAMREQRDRERERESGGERERERESGREKESERRERRSSDEQEEKNSSVARRGSSFDDFLRQDNSAGEKGAFVFSSGADSRPPPPPGLVHRRGGPAPAFAMSTASAAAAAASSANPFADENRISDEKETASVTVRDGSDDDDDKPHTDMHSASAPVESSTSTLPLPVPAETGLPSALAPSPAENAAFGNGRDRDHDHEQEALASIQSWARNSLPAFYSPLPMSPVAPVSEPEIISDMEGHEDGQLTPTDTVSLAGSGEHVAHDAASSRAGDVISVSEGIVTPTSWSDVGSVVSETEDWR